MFERDGYMPGVPCWVDTSQPDPEATVDFYGHLFGWEFENVMPAGSGGKYFIGRLRGGDVAAVGSLPDGGPAVTVWKTYIWVQSADAGAAAAEAAGGRVLAAPFDVMDAGRMAVCADPEGGYGDFLAQSDPGLRARMAQSGGPAGFEDVVATLSPIPAGQPEIPARWSVTFSVDDADAVAAKAAELGGRVLVAPFDAPWVRMTVITDPQGATFIASKFVPENRAVAAA